MVSNIKEVLSIVKEGLPLEVRMLNVDRKGTVSGYFTDYSCLERVIKPYNGKNDIYITLNMIMPDIVARRQNKIACHVRTTTTDKEIMSRKWILVDLDPERPSGISSTDEELENAKKMSEKIMEYLNLIGFSTPVYAMSGNGYHLLYSVDFPNSIEITNLIKKFLHALDKKFSDERVKVDTSTYNPARIIKLYGTIACKGDATEERPHRMSYIISAPESSVANEAKLIHEVIDDNDIPLTKEKQLKKNNSNKLSQKLSAFEVKEWLQKNGIAINHEKPFDAGGICYVLSKCPWKPEEHTDNAAYVVQFPNGKVIAGCHHDSCSGENWDSLKRLYSYGDDEQSTPENIAKDNDESTTAILLQDIKNSEHVFFHNEEGTCYVCISEDYKIYLKLQDKQFKQYLRRRFYNMFKKSLNKDSIQQVLDTLEAKAIFDGEEREVYSRCRMEKQQIFYYIADKEQTVCCIDKDGYSICDNSPIAFIKRKSMLEQALPQKGKSLKSLTARHWKFQKESDKILHDVLLVTSFITGFPMPIVIYTGERGSAKSTSMKMDKMLIDPDAYLIKALSRSVSDLLATLSSQYLVCFDNVDKITPDMSDLFCICSTGGYYGKRKLYSDDEEYGVNLTTRLIFSGINMLSNKTDFYDRCIGFTLSRIPGEERKTEDAVMSEFKKDIPYLLGAIFETLSTALKIIDDIVIDSLPRMADFAKWGYAVAEVLGYGGETFLQLYEQNQTDINAKFIEEDSVATAILFFMEGCSYCKGSVSELLQELTECAEQQGVNIKYDWVKSANTLSRHINDLKSVLEDYDIHMNRGKADGKRYIELWKGEYPDEE